MGKIKILLAVNMTILIEKLEYKLKLNDYSIISKPLGYFLMKNRLKQYKKDSKEAIKNLNK